MTIYAGRSARVVATRTKERRISVVLLWDETFDIGADAGTPVDDRDYQVPFKFTGKLNKLTLAPLWRRGEGGEGQARRRARVRAGAGSRSV